MTTREVLLDGGSPWGFRLHGGADLHQPIRVARVNPGSKAASKGIREGDFITSINNKSTRDITNAEAHGLLRNSGETLKLGLNEDCEGSPKRRQFRTVQQETLTETIKKSSVTSYTLKTISQSDEEIKTSNGHCNDPPKSTCSSSPSDPSGTGRAQKMDVVAEERYRVESPKPNLTKSRSLDDDDFVQIQEVTDEGGISPEEELNLRNFLEGLHLVNSPEDAARKVQDVTTVDTIRSRRARKRAALEQYFAPMALNPRFLEVIDEEAGEYLKQSTPELAEIKASEPEVVFLEDSDSSSSSSGEDLRTLASTLELIQLTPPPTPDEDRLSPSPSPSMSSDSSLSTVRYNPRLTPATLRQLCINHLAAQPFGAAVLQELADVASSIERLTSKLLLPSNSFDLPARWAMQRRRSYHEDDVQRLNASNLAEWLRLAKNSRPASPTPDIYAEQMLQLQEKQRQIEEEIRRLEREMPQFREEDYVISKRGDFAETKPRPLSMPVSTEFFRQQMFQEYVTQMAAREERKHNKLIKITGAATPQQHPKPSAGIEEEFLSKVKEKQKQGKLTAEDDLPHESEPLPKHLQEFVEMREDGGVWSPGQKRRELQDEEGQKREEGKDEPVSPVWTPRSANSSPTAERKEFRSVKFESPILSRKSYRSQESPEPPWKLPESSSDTGVLLSSTLERRLPSSASSPGFDSVSRLPKVQNPTITLLQKAREGQLPKGALYIEEDQNYRRSHHEKPGLVGPGEILYKIKNEYSVSDSDTEKTRKMADLGPRKFEGIGPTTKDGMPLILRSEVKDANQSKWYKKMYDTIHKQRPHRDEYVTVKYRHKRGQYPYASGYLSEPEPGTYDSDHTDYKYATLDRRRPPKDNYVTSTMPRSEVIKHGHDPYKNQPGRIENYIPGRSSISDKEAKEHLEQQQRTPQTRSFINQALKESGYESDSTLIFRRRDDTSQQFSPSEQKEAYKIIQKGGDIPLHGLRKPAPERPKEPEPPLPPPKGPHGVRSLPPESPRKYVENEVTIHYKSPVRQEIKEYLSEDELAYRQAEAMKKIYQEERRRKYLQELQDMTNRRHTDNFVPSQKSPIPLNRYDDFDASPPVKPRPRSPEPRLLARALYNFVGQTARELTFRKGDVIYVRRQVDKNWYEGELNAMVGLFPVNYVEIVPYDTSKLTPRKSHEGQARAKFNFVAQTHLELSLAKGELVVITRRVDDNWYEGKIGGRKGIFPVSYVEVLIDPSDPPPPSSKPVAAPAAHSLLLNGSAGGKESMGSHSYTPTMTPSYHAKPVQVGYGSVQRGKNPVGQALHIETQNEPVPYRAMYKYLPQNDDELELLEGDTVYVLEKCDDGWYVGSSERTGAFGTFPGNYVEKV